MSTKAPKKAAIEASLREVKLRVTDQRVKILSLMHSDHGPFSCEEIFQKLPKGFCDLVTVYRCLESLEAADLVTCYNFQDGLKRFEVAGHHHHHFICKLCGTVEALEGCLMGPVEKDLEKKGYTSLKHNLEVYGLCPKCS